jgi:hypothetical protein
MAAAKDYSKVVTLAKEYFNGATRSGNYYGHHERDWTGYIFETPEQTIFMEINSNIYGGESPCDIDLFDIDGTNMSAEEMIGTEILKVEMGRKPLYKEYLSSYTSCLNIYTNKGLVQIVASVQQADEGDTGMDREVNISFDGDTKTITL